MRESSSIQLNPTTVMEDCDVSLNFFFGPEELQEVAKAFVSLGNPFTLPKSLLWLLEPTVDLFAR